MISTNRWYSFIDRGGLTLQDQTGSTQSKSGKWHPANDSLFQTSFPATIESKGRYGKAGYVMLYSMQMLYLPGLQGYWLLVKEIGALQSNNDRSGRLADSLQNNWSHMDET